MTADTDLVSTAKCHFREIPDIDRRLDEALASGLSGAVLIVTPDVQYSSVMSEQEIPRLPGLEGNTEFIFAIGSTISRPDGGVDYKTSPVF